MGKKNIFKLISTVFIWAICLDASAQGFLGLSVNYGDRLNFTPYYSDLLLRKKSFSPTLVYSYQQKLRSNFSVILGGQAGVAGYQLIPVFGDTLSQDIDRYPFRDYGIFVGRIEVTPGKVFHIGKRELFVGIGGGISYYLAFPFTTMGIFVTYQGAGVRVFSSYIEAPDSGIFSGFAKVYMKMPISNRFDLAFQYSSHWKSILEGEFEFYHTKSPAKGAIKLVPQGISLMLLYRFKKRIVLKRGDKVP